MTMRNSRHMTSIYLVRDDRVLLLYRVGSRAVPDSWVGIGGHLEPQELTDPAAGVLREMREEVGLGEEDVSELSLRYLAVRDSGEEIRHTSYFTGVLRDGVDAPVTCDEGELRWFDLGGDPPDLTMPPTGQVVFAHWFAEGRHDDRLRIVIVDRDGQVTGPV